MCLCTHCYYHAGQIAVVTREAEGRVADLKRQMKDNGVVLDKDYAKNILHPLYHHQQQQYTQQQQALSSYPSTSYSTSYETPVKRLPSVSETQYDTSYTSTTATTATTNTTTPSSPSLQHPLIPFPLKKDTHGDATSNYGRLLYNEKLNYEEKLHELRHMVYHKLLQDSKISLQTFIDTHLPHSINELCALTDTNIHVQSLTKYMIYIHAPKYEASLYDYVSGYGQRKLLEVVELAVKKYSTLVSGGNSGNSSTLYKSTPLPQRELDVAPTAVAIITEALVGVSVSTIKAYTDGTSLDKVDSMDVTPHLVPHNGTSTIIQEATSTAIQVTHVNAVDPALFDKLELYLTYDIPTTATATVITGTSVDILPTTTTTYTLSGLFYSHILSFHYIIPTTDTTTSSPAIQVTINRLTIAGEYICKLLKSLCSGLGSAEIGTWGATTETVVENIYSIYRCYIEYMSTIQSSYYTHPHTTGAAAAHTVVVTSPITILVGKLLLSSLPCLIRIQQIYTDTNTSIYNTINNTTHMHTTPTVLSHMTELMLYIYYTKLISLSSLIDTLSAVSRRSTLVYYEACYTWPGYRRTAPLTLLGMVKVLLGRLHTHTHTYSGNSGSNDITGTTDGSADEWEVLLCTTDIDTNATVSVECGEMSESEIEGCSNKGQNYYHWWQKEVVLKWVEEKYNVNMRNLIVGLTKRHI